MLRLGKEDVRGCRIHREIIDEAVARLLAKNAFSYSEVIDAKKLQVMAEAIRWDHVRELIEEAFDKKLVPLCQLYFKRHAPREEIENPAKFLAGAGGSKKAVGYAWVGDNTHHLFRHTLTLNLHQIDGRIKSYEARRSNVIPYIGKTAELPDAPRLPSPFEEGAEGNPEKGVA